MVSQVTWTKRANNKFNSIIAYLEKEWGSKVTENFVNRTYNIIELICDQPEIGTLENPEKNIRGFNITGHNKMFYRLAGNQLIILNFFDNRQSPEKRKH